MEKLKEWIFSLVYSYPKQHYEINNIYDQNQSSIKSISNKLPVRYG